MREMYNAISKRADKLTAQLKDKEEKLEHAIQMEEQLKEMSGLSRLHLTSKEWHKENSQHAHHFWGLGSYSKTVTYITKVWWPEIEPKVISSDDYFSECEEVLICLIRIHRDYHVKTLGSIWGHKGEGWATRLFRKWMPKLGKMGLHMSILDRDFMLDYVSAEYAKEHGLPHSSFPEFEGKVKSYAEVFLPEKYKKKGYERVGAIVDGKVFMTDTIRINYALSRLMYSEKVDHSSGLVITWTSPMGLCFEHTGLYFA